MIGLGAEACETRLPPTKPDLLTIALVKTIRLANDLYRRGTGPYSGNVLAFASLDSFSPRPSDLADRKLYAFGPVSTWSVLAPLIGGCPDARTKS